MNSKTRAVQECSLPSSDQNLTGSVLAGVLYVGNTAVPELGPNDVRIRCAISLMHDLLTSTIPQQSTCMVLSLGGAALNT